MLGVAELLPPKPARQSEELDPVLDKVEPVSNKLGQVLLIFGGLLMTAGVCLAPAGFGKDADPSVLGLSASLFSLGALCMAGGFFAKSRLLATLQEGERQISKSKKSKLQLCEACQESTAIIVCATHRASLCADCMPGHYDARACAYAPLNLGRSTAAGRA